LFLSNKIWWDFFPPINFFERYPPKTQASEIPPFFGRIWIIIFQNTNINKPETIQTREATDRLLHLKLCVFVYSFLFFIFSRGYSFKFFLIFLIRNSFFLCEIRVSYPKFVFRYDVFGEFRNFISDFRWAYFISIYL